jgi:hypothetical protein
MATRTFGAANKKWSETSAWVEGEVPTAADDVVFNASSGNCELGNTIGKCRSMDAEAYKGTFTVSKGKVEVGTTTEAPSGVALRLGAGMTLTPGEGQFRMVGTSGTVEKVSTNGKTLNELSLNGTGSKVQLEDDLKAAVVVLVKGELKTNGKTVTCSTQFGTSGTSTRVLTLGASTIKLTAATGSVWAFSEVSGLALGASSATIEVSDSTAESTKLFLGGGQSYGTLTVSGDTVVIEGSNTFATLRVNTARAPKTCKATLTGTTLTVTEGTAPKAGQEVVGAHIPAGTVILSGSGSVWTMSAAAEETVAVAEAVEIFPTGLLLVSATTQTVTTLSTNGKSGEQARLSSAEASGTYKPGTQGKLKLSGLVSLDYLRLSNVKAEGSTEVYAGANSANVAGNEGFKFEAAPSSAARPTMLI